MFRRKRFYVMNFRISSLITKNIYICTQSSNGKSNQINNVITPSTLLVHYSRCKFIFPSNFELDIFLAIKSKTFSSSSWVYIIGVRCNTGELLLLLVFFNFGFVMNFIHNLLFFIIIIDYMI